MSKKTTAPKKIAKATTSTPVRNSAIPKTKTTVISKPMEITGDMIAKKAFEIFAAGKGGSELDNWFAAERELRQAA